MENRDQSMENEKSWEKTHRENSCQLKGGLVQWDQQIFSSENNYENGREIFFWKISGSENWPKVTEKLRSIYLSMKNFWNLVRTVSICGILAWGCSHSHSSGVRVAVPKLGGGDLVAQSCSTPVTPGTVARQAPLSMGFSRQEYWSGLPFPSQVLCLQNWGGCTNQQLLSEGAHWIWNKSQWDTTLHPLKWL